MVPRFSSGVRCCTADFEELRVLYCIRGGVVLLSGHERIVSNGAGRIPTRDKSTSRAPGWPGGPAKPGAVVLRNDVCNVFHVASDDETWA